VVKADGYPAIFCMDYIAFHTIKNFDFSDEDLALPIFIFLEHFCEAGVAMSLAEVNAVTAEAPLSETLLVQIGSPLLQFDIVAYDIENRLIMYSRELHVNGFLKHTFLRKNY
jgi:DNA-binding GntR family transcriptional regulator